MPVTTCPKCPTKLRVPDGTTGNVKCPKCGNVFPAVAPAAAFEVVDDEPVSPPPPPPRAAPKSSATVKPAPKPDFEVLDDDDDDRPKSKRRRDDDDDDEERPSKKRRRDDDDEDRPRSKKRRDDDDERPSKKKNKSRNRDDDDYRPPAKSGGGFANAKTGMQLLSISLWLYLGTFGLMALFVLVAWVGVSIPNWLMTGLGVLGLANWIVGLVGLAFSIAGPVKARTLAIAATVVASLHLMLGFVIANDEKSSAFGMPAIPMLSAMSKFEQIEALTKKMMSETDPARQKKLQEEFRELIGADKDGGDFGIRRSEMRWGDLATLLPYSDNLVEVLVYRLKNLDGGGSGRVSRRDSIGFTDYLLPLAGGLLEVARLVLIVLLIGAVGSAAKAGDVTEKSQLATIGAAASAVIPMVLIVIASAISDSGKSSGSSMKGAAAMLAITALLVYLVHLGGLFLPAIMGNSASGACRRK